MSADNTDVSICVPFDSPKMALKERRILIKHQFANIMTYLKGHLPSASKKWKNFGNTEKCMAQFLDNMTVKFPCTGYIR